MSPVLSSAPVSVTVDDPARWSVPIPAVANDPPSSRPASVMLIVPPALAHASSRSISPASPVMSPVLSRALLNRSVAVCTVTALALAVVVALMLTTRAAPLSMSMVPSLTRSMLLE